MTDLRNNKRAAVSAGAAVILLAGAVGIAQATDAALTRRATPIYPTAHKTIVPLDLRVFDLAPTRGDVTAARDPQIIGAVKILTGEDAVVPESFLPGQARPGDVRIALAHLGSGDRSIFVFRTMKGRICAGLSGFSSGCLEGLPPEVPLTATAADPDSDGTGEAALVWGIARNDVQRVDVIVDGTPYPATVGRNAYFFQADNNLLRPSAIETVVAHLASGRSVSTAVLTGPAATEPRRITKGPPEAPAYP